jgi:hypothetical protein
MTKIQLLKRRNRLSLSWFSRVIILIIIFIILFFSIKNLNYYLSLNKPVPSSLLVIEGFLPDYTLRNMMREFHDGDYDKIIILGKPIGQGYYLTGYKTSADLIKETLISMGMDSTLIHTVSIPSTVKRDQTYCTGLLLSQWIDTTNTKLSRVNIYTLGCHARRSYLLFQVALGKNIDVGIISGEDRSYDKVKWWKSSKGFRTVFNESLAYLYVKLLFRYDRKNDLEELNRGYYVDQIQQKRNKKDVDFVMTKNSPLSAVQKKKFVQLNYFPIKKKYKIKALIVKDTCAKVKIENMGSSKYQEYGKVYFQIDSTNCVLTIYQNIDSNFKENKKLFIPFKDLTNGTDTYIKGRYLDISINESDSIWIDFNMVYNPNSAYDETYIFPILPIENSLQIYLNAGEQIYNKP